MATVLNDPAGGRSDSIRFGPSAYGVERAEVHIATRGFEPHRHDTYGIGVTTSGVQVFRYRGSERVCLPGQLHFLHPDEAHDGRPGTEDGFGYRILYIPPELVRGALGGRVRCRGDRPGDGDPADRVFADAVRGVQPEGH